MFFDKRKKTLVQKEKYFQKIQYYKKIYGKMSKVLTETLAKFHKIIVRISTFQNILHLFLLIKKNILVTGQSATNIFFLPLGEGRGAKVLQTYIQTYRHTDIQTLR